MMTAALDTTLELETPEHITFRYQVAGPAKRAAAYLVDLLVRIALVLSIVVVGLFAGSAASPSLRGFEAGLFLVIFFVLEWGYFVFFEVMFSGSSPGKRAFRLRVIHQDGRNVSFADSVLRNLLRAADLLPLLYAAGLASMIFDRHFRRLGDLVAKTVVVHEPVSRISSSEPARQVPVILGLSSRPDLTPDERAALTLFARRCTSFSEARAEELASLLAPRFESRFNVTHASARELLLALHSRMGGI